ncbi:MAG: 30S ribosomal protein S1 [Pseudomonadota bacterium]|nr:30S ribosomal protein S1 [Gammaproteobacteria bacterium]MBU1628982.1 30S ribosomal protein S1 [Gammaproteobacteria bacterium]MBU1926877.1 30S ribosomal protein S1 [Gammaproteobacteria bacterium]MBU2546033.1 30S ribosomal protein S1 [Gammaproteobacteria bacterium]
MTAEKGQTFAELFESKLEEGKGQVGQIITGVVVAIDNKFALVDVGLKSEGPVPLEQFHNEHGELAVQVGDSVEVVVEAIADDYGETRLSHEKAKRVKTWLDLVDCHETHKKVRGVILGKVKGGFTVDIRGIRAFLPGSLIDVRPIADTHILEGMESDFQIIKVDEERNNIVVSRRAVIEKENSAERSKLLEHLQENQVVKGVVKNLTDYGAFIDLGGIDGLLHITDISWKRVKLPSEVLKIGDSVEVVVLKFDREKNRVSLGMKQLSQDPWKNIAERYPVNSKLTGKVTNITDYGCFVELEPGIEGLVHMSEMDWTNKNVHPSKLVQPGDPVEVVVLEIDEERRRISLGMKQCKSNPWEQFASAHEVGEHLKGTIKSITDFGIFIGLDGSIDGLIHLSDLSWDEPGEQAIRHYAKGDEVEAVIMVIDPERERISLGIKQLHDDPFNNYADGHEKYDIVKGKVVEVEENQATVELAPEVVGYLKAGEISSTETVEDARTHLKEGDEVETRIININRKDRAISLSIRAKDIEPEERVERSNKSRSSKSSTDRIATPTLGDLIKEQMEAAKEE